MERLTNLVLGSEGFVGRSLCQCLSQQDQEVVRFDVKRGIQEDARSVRLPLAGVDRVYFLAWEVGGAKYLYREDVQLVQLNWNLELMRNVFRQLRQRQVPFLFVSSQLAHEVQTVYGVTKRLGEVWTELIPEGVCTRLWNVYGSYEDLSERSHVVADFVHQALAEGEIHMLTTGEEMRQFIHIEDACRGFQAALSQHLQHLCDVTSFEWTSVLDVARTIGELTGATVIPGEQKGNSPLTDHVGRIPGWYPRISLQDGLSRMIDDFRQQGSSTKRM